MTAAEKLRELLATRPDVPKHEDLIRWWKTSRGLVTEALDELDLLRERLGRLGGNVAPVAIPIAPPGSSRSDT